MLGVVVARPVDGLIYCVGCDSKGLSAESSAASEAAESDEECDAWDKVTGTLFGAARPSWTSSLRCGLHPFVVSSLELVEQAPARARLTYAGSSDTLRNSFHRPGNCCKVCLALQHCSVPIFVLGELAQTYKPDLESYLPTVTSNTSDGRALAFRTIGLVVLRHIGRP